MTTLIAKWRKFENCEQGAVAVEYGLICAALMLAIYPAFHLITSGVQAKIIEVASAFSFF